MAWIVEVEGEQLPEKFPNEEAANQAAANARGNDWDRKIVVREEGHEEPAKTKPETGKKSTANLETGVAVKNPLEAIDSVVLGAGGAGGSSKPDKK